MKSSFAAVLFAVAGVSAHKNVTYTTEVLTAVTTYCPEPTLLTHAGTTYTVTQVCFNLAGCGAEVSWNRKQFFVVGAR